MKPHPNRSLTALALAIGLTTLVASVGESLAQTQIRGNRASSTPRSTESRTQAIESLTERLPESMKEDERVSTVTNAVRSRVGDELENKSTEDLIRSAQQTMAKIREGERPETTITDTTTPPQTAQPLIPEPAASARPAAPVAAQPVALPTQPAAAPAPQMVAQVTPAPAPPGISDPSGIPAPVPLTPRYEKQKGSSSEMMEIEADSSVMDNEKRLITFSGNVIVTEPRFTMTGDNLEVWMNDETNLDGSPAANAAAGADENAPPFKRAIATGGMVEIEKIGADGKVQIAKARKADYDAATGDIVLTGGPPTLQSGSGFVNPSSPDAVIILRADGNHQLKGGTGRTKIEIPLKGGGPATTTTPLSGGLDSITNRGSR